jgi:fatty-acyl-CoA synthase
MMPEASPSAPARTLDEIESRVLDVVRALAQEVGGARAADAAAPSASLERELGFGSLERVELLSRLESAFGRRLDDAHLRLDTAAELARALAEATDQGVHGAPPRAPALKAAVSVAPAATVHESLWRRAQAEPERPHVYMREEDGREHTVTYGRLLSEASMIAGALRERGIGRGDRVALMLPTGFDFLRTFQGILTARAVPVPIYPPVRLDRLEEYAQRQSRILADAGARLLVTVSRAKAVTALLKPAVPSLRDVVTPDELSEMGASWARPESVGSDPAFIQYTSGSTGSPKGVLLTHDNLMANIRAIAAGVDARPTDVGCSWLPLYHDMGLIGSWLFCMHHGIPIAILSPLAFLSRPERWLWTIHERRVSLSPAPNFAYELCVRKIPDSALEGLDLSSWRCALNGAEPVNPDTLERFARRFAPFGFRREALLPVYGLAENSVALTVPPPGRGPRIDRIAREPFARDGRAQPAGDVERAPLRFVSVGRALPEHELRIVDEGGKEVPERTVGHIVFRGPSQTAGYFGQPEATAAVTLPGGWLDSGDLGYVAEGELHVTGRRKDLIIKAGRNLVPQEIEEAAASVEGVRKGCVVAFGVDRADQGTESLIVVAETRATDGGERARLAAGVTERVASTTGVPPDEVALVAPGAVPKTSSGKVRRAETRELYLVGGLGRSARLALGRKLRLVGAAAGTALRERAVLARELAQAIRVGLVAAFVFLPLWLAAMMLPGRRTAFSIGRSGARVVLRLLGCRLSAAGLENLAAHGPSVLASNHASYADVAVLLALLPSDFLFVAKHEIRNWPLVGPYVRKTGHLLVDRWDFRQGVEDTGRVARAIEDGESVLFFPEATFTAAAGLRPFRLGAFKIAVDTGAPVVPLALTGTRGVLRAGWRLPRPGRIHLWVGPPVVPEGDGWRAVVALRDRVADVIASHCGEPRLDLVAAGPERS